MDSVTLYLTRKAGKDDVIRIRTDDEYRSVFEVRYQAADAKNAYEFFLSESDVLHYIGDIFRSLDVDVDPFIHLQVSTMIHPSVMYDVADLGDCCTRNTILDIIRTALHVHAHRVKTVTPK